MPAIERAFCAPASRGRDYQICSLHEFSIALQELLQTACPTLDLKMGKVGLQTLGQGPHFVAATRRGTQRIWLPESRLTLDTNLDQRTRGFKVKSTLLQYGPAFRESLDEFHVCA